MNIFDMKELDQLAVDELAKAFDRISCNCTDFGGEIECTYSPMEDKWRVRKELHGEEEMRLINMSKKKHFSCVSGYSF